MTLSAQYEGNILRIKPLSAFSRGSACTATKTQREGGSLLAWEELQRRFRCCYRDTERRPRFIVLAHVNSGLLGSLDVG